MARETKQKSNQRNFTAYDMYRYYTTKLLEENPNYKAEYDKIICVKGIFVIYKVVDHVKTFIVDYRMFRKVLETYNLKATDAVIQGERLNLGYGLGFIQGRRIERSFTRPQVDFGASYKARLKDPKAEYVYYTSEDYCRIAWNKQGGVKNSYIYEFVPAATANGFRKRFSRALIDNPLLKFRYEYKAITARKRVDEQETETYKQAA